MRGGGGVRDLGFLGGDDLRDDLRAIAHEKNGPSCLNTRTCFGIDPRTSSPPSRD